MHCTSEHWPPRVLQRQRQWSRGETCWNAPRRGNHSAQQGGMLELILQLGLHFGSKFSRICQEIQSFFEPKWSPSCKKYNSDLWTNLTLQGADHLTITWKVADNRYHHIDVKEEDKVGFVSGLEADSSRLLTHFNAVSHTIVSGSYSGPDTACWRATVPLIGRCACQLRTTPRWLH